MLIILYGTIPCTKPMTQEEIYSNKGYEHTTGEVMIREFRERNVNPLQVPAVLVHGHLRLLGEKLFMKLCIMRWY